MIDGNPSQNILVVLQAGSGNYVDIKQVQIEFKSYLTPFINGTIGASSLTYNLNSSIGLDWSGDWTICYWKKPMATQDDSLNYYNIESVGCNGNSVGGGYVWWGKNAGNNTISNSYPTDFSPTDYFGKCAITYMPP